MAESSSELQNEAEDVGDEIVIRKLEPGDSFAGLSLGEAEFTPLKTFAKQHAQNHQKDYLAVTYVAVNEATHKLLGYVTLVCGQIEASDDAKQAANNDEYRYDHFPAVKLARLAVDKRYRGAGLGKQLVELSLGIAKDKIAPVVGCRFMVLDAKQKSIEFYKKHGFTLVNSVENEALECPVMFMDLMAVDI